MKKVEDKLGPVEVLVNNAGIARDAMLHRMTPLQIGQAHEAAHIMGGGSIVAVLGSAQSEQLTTRFSSMRTDASDGRASSSIK